MNWPFVSRIPSSPDITTEKSKASWELRKGNVGVYAIQGRRPHMEDRFNVVNDLEHTNTSIYGIFDGHGGEVRIEPDWLHSRPGFTWLFVFDRCLTAWFQVSMFLTLKRLGHFFQYVISFSDAVHLMCNIF